MNQTKWTPYWQVCGMVLLVKALIFLFGAVSFQVHSNLPTPFFDEFLAIWNRWDSLHYLDIAREGYASSGKRLILINFFPLFPWMVRLFAVFLGNFVFSALLVSGVASLAAGAFLYRLVSLDDSSENARQAVFFFLIFPTSFFLHIGYPESLFMALVLGSFLAARQRQWLLAGLAGALACLTRANGLLLIPALAMEAYQQYREGKRWRWEWLWLGLAILGFGGYLFLNYKLSGDPFLYLSIKHEVWNKKLAWPWTSFYESAKTLAWRTPSAAQMVVWQEFFFALLAFVLTVISLKKLRPSYTVWMVSNWLLFTGTFFILSVPRYVLVMFPIFILFARLAKNHLWNTLLTVWSILFLALFISLFVKGGWVF